MTWKIKVFFFLMNNKISKKKKKDKLRGEPINRKIRKHIVPQTLCYTSSI
jgi:hypothetical protein